MIVTKEQFASAVLERFGGLIDEDLLRSCFSLAAEKKEDILTVLLYKGCVSRTEAASVLKELTGCGFWMGAAPCAAAAALVDPETAYRLKFVPLEFEKERLAAGMPAPYDVQAADEISSACGFKIEPVYFREDKIFETLDCLYGVGASNIDSMRRSALELLPAYPSGDSFPADGWAARYVTELIASCCRRKATDLHLFPCKSGVVVRARVDGRLEPLAVPKEAGQLKDVLTRRIKIMSGMDTSQDRIPQDGAFHLTTPFVVEGRVATLPTPLGESVRIRFLPGSAEQIGLEDLGYCAQDAAFLENAARMSCGMIVITGPTGCGKTTSLYALLQRIDRARRSVVTVEDPVERRLDGIVQVQASSGLPVSSFLRAALRHDPDVLLIGEVRDTESAKAAVRMALTGHLVLTTMHTSSGSGVPGRLIELGIEPYFVAQTLRVVVSQRLVELKAAKEAGRGRGVVYEIIKFNERMRRVVKKTCADETAIAIEAAGQGTVFLEETLRRMVKDGFIEKEEADRHAADIC